MIVVSDELSVDDDDIRFRNHYYCDACDCAWEDCWCTTSNDRCPSCDVEVEPFTSEDF
jgi:hypothetical protein